MTNNIGISFIVPCFNCALTVRETFESIINLNYPLFQICAVNDSSSDNTQQILEEYKNKYPNIFSIENNVTNQGGAITRNKCVELSKFDYIYCVDSDNILDLKSFYKLINAIDVNTKVISPAGIKFFMDIGPFKLFIREWEFIQDEMVFKDMRKTNCHPVASGNYLFTKESFTNVGGYETDLGALDAFSLGYKFLNKGYKIKIAKNSFYLHRLHTTSYWLREKNNNNTNFIKLINRYPGLFTNEDLETLNSSNDPFTLLTNVQNDFAIIKERLLVSILKKLKGIEFK